MSFIPPMLATRLEDPRRLTRERSTSFGSSRSASCPFPFPCPFLGSLGPVASFPSDDAEATPAIGDPGDRDGEPY